MAYEQIATEFAGALTRGDFDAAHGMLSAELKQQLSAESLRAEFDSMTDYFDSAARVDEHTETMSDWPAKRPDELGWVYVSISGNTCSEAVIVIVSRAGDGVAIGEVISSIEWGRP